MKDITTTLFKVPASAAVSPSRGTLLVADPFTRQGYFRQGVVALIDYLSSEGATGVVLNKPTEYMLGDLLEGIAGASEIPVYCGGPSGQDRIFFIHTLGPDVIEGGREFAPGLYVGGNFDDVVSYINAGYPIEGFVRFFVGFTSWSEGEIEREIANDSWAVIPGNIDSEQCLCGTGNAYWHRSVRALGERYRSWQLIPGDPEVN